MGGPDELSVWQEIALIVAPVASAVAALGSWAAVLLARRAAREARAPRLHIQFITGSCGTVGATVTNVGEGAAVGTCLYLAQPPHYLHAALFDGLLFPGEARHVSCLLPRSAADAEALTFCRDRGAFAHYWNVHERHKVLKKRLSRQPRYRTDIYEVWLEFHPRMDLREMTRVECTVSDATPSGRRGSAAPT